jgi:NAD(P)-dependent dehydrogenase (short-subunit alcohol dehydrogenase family)
MVAFVTGTGSEIGRTIPRAFGLEGTDVAAADVAEHPAAIAENRCRGLPPLAARMTW